MQVRNTMPSLQAPPSLLSTCQKYSNALSQGNIIDQDTIHLLFPNLNKLLNFQRKFLIRFESTAELSWQSQQWGQLFLESVRPRSLYGRSIVLITPLGRRIRRLRTLLRKLHQRLRAHA